MSISRRDLGLLLPALAASAKAQQPQTPALPKPGVLPSKLYRTEDIPYTGDDKKRGRRIFLGTTHTGFNLEMHETVLAPGEISHPPHKHVHEEIIVIVEGTIEASIEGRIDRATAGSVSFFASNEMHNFKNIGAGHCRYYVLELRADAA
jgi:quercetin dioxygenase-like cupin family protein